MYSTNGDFGQVRIANMLPTLQSKNLFSLHVIGWHKCNDLYRYTYEHGNPNHLLFFTVRGCGSLTINGQKYSLPAGTITFIPRNTPCQYSTPKNGLWEFYWLHTAGRVATEFMDTIGQNGNYLTDFEPGYNYTQRLEELIRLCSKREHNAELYISQNLSELLHHVMLRLSEPPENMSLSSRAIFYLEHHFHAHLSVEDTAQSLFVSPAHLIRTFKKETGYTPHEYMNEYRLMIAAQLLEFGQQRVEEIAAQTGFSSPSHFISCFRKQYGCTPLQYRGMAAFTQKDKDKQY